MHMKENFRLFFSIIVVCTVGTTFALGLATIVTWGGYAEYFLAALILLVIGVFGTLVTSL